MRKTIVPVCAALMFMAACAKSNDSSNGNVNPPNNKGTMKVEDVKYAGAEVFEFGIAKGDLDSKNLKPLSRIYVCVDRSGTNQTGKFTVDFAALGVAPYRAIRYKPDGHEIAKIWDLPSLTINYTFSGKIVSVPPYAYGEVTIKTQTSDQNWMHIQPADGAKRSDDYAYFDLFGPFHVDNTGSSLMSGATSWYDVNGVTYYINSSLLRFTMNKDDGSRPIDDCESQNQTVFVKPVNR
jgi:hypothetical protein